MQNRAHLKVIICKHNSISVISVRYIKVSVFIAGIFPGYILSFEAFVISVLEETNFITKSLSNQT